MAFIIRIYHDARFSEYQILIILLWPCIVSPVPADYLLWVVLLDVLYGYELKCVLKFAFNISQFCTAKAVEGKYRQVSIYTGYTFLKTVAQIKLHKLKTIFPFKSVSAETASQVILTLQKLYLFMNLLNNLYLHCLV